MSSPQQQWLPPRPPPARRGLPGWAIALIAVLGGGALLVLVLGISLLMWFGSVLTAIPTQFTPPPPPSAPSAPGAPWDELELDEVPEMGPSDSTSGESAAELADRTTAMYERYLAASKDGTIADLVPNGDAVDPRYFSDFLYLLADLKGATAFMGAGDTAAIADIGEQVDELERRFLAGEDLGSSVKITRSDGSVYESDGRYRLRD